MKEFGSLTIRLSTSKPMETDTEINERGEEFEQFRDHMDAAARSFVAPGWEAEVSED